MTEDFYDLLDVPADASQDEIKDAYREQVRVYHPDLNDDDRAQAQFTAVKKAYDILGDPVERQAYDRLGHEEYVAKRTSGIPSPDVWKSSDDSDADDSSDESTAERTATAGAAAGTSGSTTSNTGTTSSTGTRSSAGASSSTGATSSTDSSASASSASTGTGPTAGTAGASTSATGTASGTTSSTDGGTARATAGGTAGPTGRSRSTTETGWLGDNAVARWWRRQNFSLPLIWLSVLIYLAGLGQFALENEAGLETLRAELAAAGTDAGAIAETLTGERYGIDSSLEYLTAFELVAPPLEESLWYAALAGAVVLTLLALLAVRVYRDDETWGPVSIDETIVAALAVTATTVLVGGPLLAGAVLMPVLFGVIVRHTRRGPGWKPSYLYLLPVLGPLAGFGLAAAGAATLATDLATLVVLPLIGGLGLPLRATIRKRFGR